MRLSHNAASFMDEARIAKFWSQVNQPFDGCWEWTGNRSFGGYGQFKVQGINRGAHRLAYQLIYGEIPDGLVVCHRCDNPPCCNPIHLWLGTDKDNMEDRDRKGRGAKVRCPGERNGMVKLKDELVEAIRTEYEPGITSQYRLAKKYGVSQTHVGRILRGERRNSPRIYVLPRYKRVYVSGEKNGRAKLSAKDVEEIRKLYHAGNITQKELALKYKVHQTRISTIVRQKQWLGTKTEIPPSWRVGQKGESNGRAILTMERAQEIRHLYQSGGFSYKDLGLKFGVHKSQVQRIVKNKAWAE